MESERSLECTEKYRGAGHRICNSKLDVTNEIPGGFHNGLNYDYHFIIKQLVNEFEEKIWIFREKHRKVQNFFDSKIKRSCKNR